jgi:hypothetical protein
MDREKFEAQIKSTQPVSSNQPIRSQPVSGGKNKKILALVIIGVIIVVAICARYLFHGEAAPIEIFQKRTSAEIVSEVEGVQLAIQGYYDVNVKKYPIKTSPTKLIDLKSDVSQLVGYTNNRLKGDGKKDFLYQSNAEGTLYVIFATLPKASQEIKSSAPSGFTMPRNYNYWVTNVKAKKK